MSTSRKDEIIKLQNEIIQSMARRNLTSVYNDFFPASRVDIPSLEKEKEQDKPMRPSDQILAGNDGTAASTGNGKTTSDAKPQEVPKEKLEDLLAELNGYIGLDTVKEEIDTLVHWIQMQQLRKEHDLPTSDLSLHMVFSGNPGTGKTTIARFLSKIFHSLGILSRGQLVEVDRGDLVAGYVGQTAIKTKDCINKAMGGVLFIDEAYALTNRGENDYGAEAVDTLLKAMEDHRDDLIVIVAGYIEPMEKFLHSNPGLESRFNRFIDFPDYTLDELMGIFDMRMNKAGYTNLHVFPNGKEAWDFMCEKKEGGTVLQDCHCIITDIEMPQMDGHRFCKLVKDDEKMRAIPVIIFSSLINDDIRRKGESVGADAQLTKPEIGKLVDAIDGLVDKYEDARRKAS